MRKLGISSGTELTERPLLYEDLQDVYVAFFQLGAGRQYNEAGPQPIPYTDVLAYLDDHRIVERDDRDEFVHYIRALDHTYLKHTHETMKAERDRLLNKSSSGKSRGGKR